jgi:hypothetical protein
MDQLLLHLLPLIQRQILVLFKILLLEVHQGQ